MKIFCRTFTGKTLEFDADPSWTFFDLSRAIQINEGISPDQQDIIFAGNRIQPEMTLVVAHPNPSEPPVVIEDPDDAEIDEIIKEFESDLVLTRPKSDIIGLFFLHEISFLDDDCLFVCVFSQESWKNSIERCS